MKSVKRPRRKIAQVDVPNREYARFAAQWFPELNFDYPYSPGYGDMDVPPTYRKRIDDLIDRATLPSDAKIPYSAGVSLALGVSPENLAADRARHEQPDPLRYWIREVERSHRKMKSARKPLVDLIRNAALPETSSRSVLAAAEDYAQAAFELGLDKGQFEEQVRQNIVRVFDRVDEAAKTRRERPKGTGARMDATVAFLERHPRKLGLSAKAWLRTYGDAWDAALIAQKIPPLGSREAREKLINNAGRSKHRQRFYDRSNE